MGIGLFLADLSPAGFFEWKSAMLSQGDQWHIGPSLLGARARLLSLVERLR